jgi:hypothetical protein
MITFLPPNHPAFFDQRDVASAELDMTIWHCGVAEDGSVEFCSEDVCAFEVGVGEIGAEEHRASKVRILPGVP